MVKMNLSYELEVEERIIVIGLTFHPNNILSGRHVRRPTELKKQRGFLVLKKEQENSFTVLEFILSEDYPQCCQGL